MSTATGDALVALLLPWALGYYMPDLLASETPNDSLTFRVIVMEDGHFHDSPSMGWEWDYSPDNPGCFNKGGTDRGVMGAHGDWVGKAEMVV